MKQLLTLPNLILLLSFAMLMMSCQKENETVEVLTPNVTLESTERTCVTNCTQCPQDFCCCVIEVLDPTGTSIDVQFCGNLPGCTGINTCSISATGNCPEIIGRIVEEELIPGTPFYYCQEKDEAIRITNLSTIHDLGIRITCAVAVPDTVGTPYIINVLIPSLESKTILVNNNCEPEDCN